MMKLKCMIVDDEALALDILENYILRLDNLELVARCQNAIEAFNVLQNKKIDLIFLDIQMPKLTGIDFLKNLSSPPKIILTTAYRDYALEGYELNVLDYLLKPISFERFFKSINKVWEMSQTIAPQNPLDNSGLMLANTHQGEGFIYIKADKKMVRLMLRDILYIESLKDYVRVKTTDKEIISYQRISYLEEKLPEDVFVRVHRSFIVAIDKIEAFSSHSVEIQKKEIPIGRNYKNEVFKILGQNNLLED
jgi:DNA-binding LytR/AlgR family response regulator